ncbi:MAG: hypothetical protein ACK41C_07865 [Phenylobacterium sp.]|uniref:hypothetical protein n=1 Tax=Phenylobacterium sp. TaxID=1871053 RepID=UPI003918DF31
MPQPNPDAPAQLSELLRGEHMLLWSFRAIAFGRGDCALVRRQFEEACGPLATEALAALTVFVRELGVGGKRRLTLAAPGSFSVTCDEQTILAAFAAAQAEEYGRMEAHLSWLTGDAVRPPFPAACCLLAQAFAMNDLSLRCPPASEPKHGAPGAAAPARLACVHG